MLLDGLSDAALSSKADLVALRTHGKAGTKAFWSKSLGARLTARIRLPILFLPIGAKGPRRGTARTAP